MAIPKQSTKDRILESAFEELIEKGFVRFTIQGVAERTQISLGNLTYHFPNREQLIQAMIDRWFEAWKIEFTQIIEKKIGDSRPDIAGFIDWVMDNALLKENVRTFTELWAIANHEPKVAKILDKLYEQAINTVLETLGHSTTSKKSTDLRALLYLLASVSEGSVAVLGNSPKNDPRRKMVKQQIGRLMTPLFEACLPPTKIRVK